jgi:hypothetical protein
MDPLGAHERRSERKEGEDEDETRDWDAAVPHAPPPPPTREF